MPTARRNRGFTHKDDFDITRHLRGGIASPAEINRSDNQGEKMLIKIICVGKIKEKFYRDAVLEYVKRLSRYSKIEIVECANEKTPDNASAELCDQIKSREGERILGRIKDNDHVIALAIDGKMYSSESLSEHLDKLMLNGKSTLVFVIGGSLGLSGAVLARANEKLSFSAMTFPHQLMRVILLEQVYRSFRIMKGEPYHK